MSDPFYTYRPLLDLIGRSEGTDKGRGYNESLAYGAYTGGPRDLVRMTLDEIDHLQTAMLAHPENKLNSSALGRYQIIRTTLRDIRKKLKLSGTALFDRGMQDRLGCFLLGKRGIDRFIAGKMSRAGIINALAQEWASLPTTSGKGHYSGQRASVTLDDVNTALDQVQIRAGKKTAEKPASTQNAPGTNKDTAGSKNDSPAPAPARKQMNLWVALLSVLGIGGSGAAAQADPDRAAAWILVGLAVVIPAVVIFLVLRRRK